MFIARSRRLSHIDYLAKHAMNRRKFLVRALDRFRPVAATRDLLRRLLRQVACGRGGILSQATAVRKTSYTRNALTCAETKKLTHLRLSVSVEVIKKKRES